MFTGDDDKDAITHILQVGTSAGGARAKAVLAWNPETGEFRSGQAGHAQGFEHWIMKFDGVTSTMDPEISSPLGYGVIEYAYHKLAVEAGIEMTECRLHHEGGRSHFMTKRFDRTSEGGKIHMQSLGALAHFDYRQVGGYSYEQAIHVIKRLGLPRKDIEQFVLRAFFNVVGRNCDDHVKNTAFLMDRQGGWRISPAFDVSYAWNPAGDWTGMHQMSINGRREGFEKDDMLALASIAGIKKARGIDMLDRVITAVRCWPVHAEAAGVPGRRIDEIRLTHLTGL